MISLGRKRSQQESGEEQFFLHSAFISSRYSNSTIFTAQFADTDTDFRLISDTMIDECKDNLVEVFRYLH